MNIKKHESWGDPWESCSSALLISLQTMHSLKLEHCLRAEYRSFPLQFTSNDFIFLLMPPTPPPSPTSGLNTIQPFNGTLIVFHVYSQPTGQQPLVIGWFFQGQFRGYHE